MSERPTNLVLDDDDYASSEDDDFAPEADNGSSGSESEEEEEDTKAGTKGKKKPKAKATTKDEEPAIDQDEVEYLRQDAGIKKRKRKGADGDEFESGGEGGFVKTRSMLVTQKEEKKKKKKKKSLASGTGATIDVDAIWKQMNESSLGPQRKTPPPVQASPSKSKTTAPTEAAEADSNLITITQTYTFAGQTHTKTVQVPRDSAQAKAHQENPSLAAPPSDQKLGPDGKPLRRPLRRISPFDPNPEGNVKGLPDPNNPFRKPIDSKNKNKGPKQRIGIPKVKQPTKLNVVDKSKLDWAAHVDAIGAREELDAAQKAKGNYLEQRDFLDRVGGRQDDAYVASKVK